MSGYKDYPIGGLRLENEESEILPSPAMPQNQDEMKNEEFHLKYSFGNALSTV
jgi:hypothetical protein